MFRRSLIAAAVALAAGCAGQQGAQQGAAEGQQAEAQESRQKIINQGYFDVAYCHPETRTLPNPVNQEALIGLLVSARPEVIECLVDPANRGQNKETMVTVNSTVTDAGVQYTATGDNLTEAGAKCIQSRVAPLAKIEPLPKGAQPVTAEIQVHHETGKALPGVVMGNNDASDIVGKIRLATPQWCDCFADWKSTPPEELAAEITVTRASPNFQANFTPPTTEAGKKVVACIEPKVEALSHAITSGDKVQVPKYPFIFIHSGMTETPTNAEPLVQFLQLDSVRAQAQGDAAIAYGERVNAVTRYDGMVKDYQKIKGDWRKADKMVPKLVEQCQELIKADDAWANALDRQLKVEQATLAKASAFKAQEEGWAPVEEETQKQLAETEKQLATVKQLRTTDEQACPKVKGKK